MGVAPRALVRRFSVFRSYMTLLTRPCSPEHCKRLPCNPVFLRRALGTTDPTCCVRSTQI